MTLIFVHVS